MKYQYFIITFSLLWKKSNGKPKKCDNSIKSKIIFPFPLEFHRIDDFDWEVTLIIQVDEALRYYD